MLTPFWFNTREGLGYGVTAVSQQEALRLLGRYGYPRSGEEITDVVRGIRFANLDQNHVVQNAGPMVVRGVWYPRHNV